MSTRDLLIELGSEELPPKALRTLAETFFAEVLGGLTAAGLSHDSQGSCYYATPRRLAVLVKDLAEQQPDRPLERRGPALAAAYKNGEPTPALQGFARSCGVEVSALETLETDKGAWLVCRSTEQGQAATALIPGLVSAALDKLPIPKRMRWGASKVQFVRPVQWLVLLFGDEVVPGEVLGLSAGNVSYGHRFHAPGAIELANPSVYESKLDAACVVADFAKRRERILDGVRKTEQFVSGIAHVDEALLDEVTALVEWPVPLLGNFEERFLAVPQEALISTMEGNQKYFPVLDGDGKLMPHFIFISNLDSPEPYKIVAGNEKVVRPRLTDAEFFFNQDRKQTLSSHNAKNANVVFQAELGTLTDKAARVAVLAKHIAERIGARPDWASRAAVLSKADLATAMVGEFPELQGIMGMHYARHEGEPEEVALALNEQYMPRFAGDELPSCLTGCAVALAEKLDTLVGIFGIGQFPTGSKDPYALRRATLGVLRIIIEKGFALDLVELIALARAQYNGRLSNAKVDHDVFEFVLARYRAMYEEQNLPVPVILAVQALKPREPLDFDRRVKAVTHFQALPEAEALAAANKRVSNILTKAGADFTPGFIDESLLVEAAEKALCEAMKALTAEVEPLFVAGEYTQALAKLAALRAPVDQFFDDVMVMADDAAVRNNRLRLLSALRELFLRVADISLLQAG